MTLSAVPQFHSRSTQIWTEEWGSGLSEENRSRVNGSVSSHLAFLEGKLSAWVWVVLFWGFGFVSHADYKLLFHASTWFGLGH